MICLKTEEIVVKSYLLIKIFQANTIYKLCVKFSSWDIKHLVPKMPKYYTESSLGKGLTLFVVSKPVGKEKWPLWKGQDSSQLWKKVTNTRPGIKIFQTWFISRSGN